MRYVMARYETELREDTYRYYLTDTLYHQGHNKVLTVRYFDMMNKRQQEKLDGDKIAADVIARAGLVVK